MRHKIAIEIDDDRLLNIEQWRVLVVFLSGEICSHCRVDSEEISVRKGKRSKFVAHHKDRDRSNNRLANGECLCWDCHEVEHKQEQIDRTTKRNASGLARAGGAGFKKWLSSLSESDRQEWISERAKKTGKKCEPNCSCGRHRRQKGVVLA